jgi:hypothetical protein
MAPKKSEMRRNMAAVRAESGLRKFSNLLISLPDRILARDNGLLF